MADLKDPHEMTIYAFLVIVRTQLVLLLPAAASAHGPLFRVFPFRLAIVARQPCY